MVKQYTKKWYLCTVVMWKWYLILLPKQGTIPILFLCFFRFQHIFILHTLSFLKNVLFLFFIIIMWSNCLKRDTIPKNNFDWNAYNICSSLRHFIWEVNEIRNLSSIIQFLWRTKFHWLPVQNGGMTSDWM